MLRHQKISYQKVFSNHCQLGEKAFVGLSSLRPPSDCSIPKNKSSEEGGEYAHVGVGVVHNKVKTALMSHFNFLNLMNQMITIKYVKSAILYYKVKECFLYLTREILRMAILMRLLTEFGSNMCVWGCFAWLSYKQS